MAEQFGGASTGLRVPRPPLLPGSYVQGTYGPVLISPGVVPIQGWSPYSVWWNIFRFEIWFEFISLCNWFTWCRHLLALYCLPEPNPQLEQLLYMEWHSYLLQHMDLQDLIPPYPLLLVLLAAAWVNKFSQRGLANLNASTIWKLGTVNMDHLVGIIILGIGSYQGQIVSLVQLVFHFVRYAKLFSVYSFESLIF